MTEVLNKKRVLKDEIVLAAVSALEKSGLPALSYETIAEEAGMSRQRVKYHFSQPESLMLAVCDYLARAYHNAMETTGTGAKGKSRLSGFLDFYFDLLDGHPKPAGDWAYESLFGLAAGYPELRHKLHSQNGTLGYVLSEEIQSAYPELPQRAVQELSYLSVIILHGHWRMVATLGYAEDHKFVSRSAVDRLIRSYLAMPNAPVKTEAIWGREKAI